MNKLDPSDYSQQNLLALWQPANFVLNRMRTALGLLHDVVQESSADYWYERGRKVLSVGERDEAIYAFELCIKLAAEHWRATLQLAALLTKQRQVESGAALLSQALGLSFSSWVDFVGELTNEDWQMIRTELEACKKKSECSTAILSGYSLADVAIKIPDHYEIFSCNEIVTDYGERNDYQVHTEHMLKIRGIVKFFIGDYIGAVAELDRFIMLNPDDANAYNIRGSAKENINDFIGASADFNHTVTLNPTYGHAYNNRGFIKETLKDYAGALEDYNIAVGIESIQSYFFNRAKVKKYLGDNAGAAADRARA